LSEDEATVNKVATRGSTKKKSGQGPKRKKKSNRSSSSPRKEPESDGDPHQSIPVPTLVLPPAELEKGVEPID